MNFKQNATIKITAIILISIVYCKAQLDSLIITEMHSFIKDEPNNPGFLFGYDNGSNVKIWTVGAIDKSNDLMLACPTSKPCLTYLFLKTGINLNLPISQWFPKEEGYKRSDSITIKMLMLNSSGIKDYVRLIPINPDSIISINRTIDVAYKNNTLLFSPGSNWEYSNTNFNLLGLILEKETGKTIDKLIFDSFHKIAPTLKMDDGKGRYPSSYIKPWPYHWSAQGYAGGLIGTAEDAIKAFRHITKQKEFIEMSKSYNLNGSVTQTSKFGLSLYINPDFNGLGKAIFYDGNIMASRMDIFLIEALPASQLVTMLG